jgi:predicted MFS family arabinose efflux permease
MSGPSAPEGNRWTALAVLTLARTAMGFQFQSVGAVSPLLIERLHLSNAELGWLVGLFSMPGIFLSLPGGLLSARFGDRPVVLTGLGLMTVGSVVMGGAESYATIVLGRLMTAVGAILLNVLLTKMVTDWFAGGEIIWAMTILINAWPVGISLALLVLPAIANAWGMPAVFHVAAGVAVLGGLGIALAYRPAPHVASGARARGLSELSRSEIGLVGMASVPWMLYNVGFAVMLGFLPSLLVRGGLSLEQAGVLLGVTTLLFIGSVLLGGASAQWLARPEFVIAAGALAYAVGLAVLPYAPPWPTLLAVGILGGLPAGSLAAAPAFVLRPESRSAGMGLFYTMYYLGMALMPPVAGWLQDTAGRSAAVYFAAATILVTLPCYLGFRALSAAYGPRSVRSADQTRPAA